MFTWKLKCVKKKKRNISQSGSCSTQTFNWKNTPATEACLLETPRRERETLIFGRLHYRVQWLSVCNKAAALPKFKFEIERIVHAHWRVSSHIRWRCAFQWKECYNNNNNSVVSLQEEHVGRQKWRPTGFLAASDWNMTVGDIHQLFLMVSPSHSKCPFTAHWYAKHSSLRMNV